VGHSRFGRYEASLHLETGFYFLRRMAFRTIEVAKSDHGWNWNDIGEPDRNILGPTGNKPIGVTVHVLGTGDWATLPPFRIAVPRVASPIIPIQLGRAFAPKFAGAVMGFWATTSPLPFNAA
jgi:hypothetical protein